MRVEKKRFVNKMSVSTKKNKVEASSIGKQVVNISPIEKLELIKKV